MARSDGVVTEVRELTQRVVPAEPESAAPRVRVVFGAGYSGLLDMRENRARAWVDVLASLRETGQPAYVEIDPESELITELLLPIRFLVGAIERVNDGIQVDLVISQARHYLRRSNERFDALRDALQSALERRTPVLVTETLDDHEIIDVRPTGEPPVNDVGQPAPPATQA